MCKGPVAQRCISGCHDMQNLCCIFSAGLLCAVAHCCAVRICSSISKKCSLAFSGPLRCLHCCAGGLQASEAPEGVEPVMGKDEPSVAELQKVRWTLHVVSSAISPVFQAQTHLSSRIVMFTPDQLSKLAHEMSIHTTSM